MPHALLRLLSVSTVAALLAAPRIADACSCFQPGEGFVAPLDGASDVPVNAKIWVGSRWATPVLLDEQGEPVPTTETQIEGNDMTIVVLTPVQPLTPGAWYQVDGGYRTSFTVGTSTDATAPTIPTEVHREAFAEHPEWDPFGGESSCGDADEVYIRVELEHDGVLAVVDADGATDLDPTALTGGVTTAAFPKFANIGRGVCLHSWPEIEEGSTANLRYGSFDLAGHFSGWSEVTRADVPSAGCGCTTTAHDAEPTTLAPLALLALLALRRRR